jgi:hypothetical protein
VLCAGGATFLTLPVLTTRQLPEAVAAASPDIVVIAGQQISDAEVARWAYAVHRAAGDLPFVLYHRGVTAGMRDPRRRILSPAPTEAQAAITKLTRGLPGGHQTPKPPASLPSGRLTTTRAAFSSAGAGKGL